MSSFQDSEKWKACCHVSIIPFKDQKPTIILFFCDGTHCFARKMSRDSERETASPILKNFLHQSQPSTSETESKRQKNFHLCHNRVDFPLGDGFNQKIFYILHLYTFSLHYSNMNFSVSTLLSGLSTLQQIQWLWLQKMSSKKWQ